MGRWLLLGIGLAAGCGAKASSGGFVPSGDAATGGQGLLPNGSGDAAGASNEDAGSSSSTTGSSNGSSSGASTSSGSSSGESGSTDAGGGGGSSASPTCSTPPSSKYLPAVSGTCPTIATGTITVSGQQVQIWAGSGEPGPLLFYWHGTGGSSSEVTFTFGQAQVDDITAAGGVVASFNGSTSQGTDTGDGVWYTGDFAMADQILACAIEQKRVDPCRVYTSGASAGGLQTTWMAYARSGYIASAASLSGGMTGAGGFNLDPQPQDPTNIVPAMAIHGAEGMDVVVIDFAVASAAWEADVAMRGGFSMDCNTGGGHVSGPPEISPGMWQFFKDHPFKVKPQPYPPIPAVFPSYCKVGPRAADGGAG
jgi:hypothetical protein